MKMYLVASEPVDKHKATKESGSRPLHSHTGTPDRLNTEKITCREAVFTTV